MKSFFKSVAVYGCEAPGFHLSCARLPCELFDCIRELIIVGEFYHCFAWVCET